jgi:hypothetical protein
VTKEGKVTFTGRLGAWWDDLTKGSPIIGMIVEGGIGSIPVVGTVIGIYEAYEVVSDANSSGKDRVIAIVGVIPGGKLVKILARVGGDKIAAVVAKGKRDKAPHGNTVDDRPATLYEKYDKDGNFQKHGVTKHEDPSKRYTSKEIDGGTVVAGESGPRREMILKEREKVETNPGPDNREPWAGRRKKQ